MVLFVNHLCKDMFSIFNYLISSRRIKNVTKLIKKDCGYLKMIVALQRQVLHN